MKPPEHRSAATHPAPCWLQVALDVPLPGPFDYQAPEPLESGSRVIVPFGRRKLVGVVVATVSAPGIPAAQVKPIEAALDDLPPLPPDWLRLARFAAAYYHRPLGEVMLPALPAGLRKPAAYLGPRAAGGPVRRLDRRKRVSLPGVQPLPAPALNAEQQAAVDAIVGVRRFQTLLLHGITGSGKTEVYLRAIQATLARGGQVLLLVPEINLTPQLEQTLRARLADFVEPGALAVLHSGLSEGERLRAWLDVQRGQARVLLGTRLAVLAPVPDLSLIIVDEEHDSSYKQQDGLRYSARDLAVWRGRDRDVPVVLGSATPSLESWRHAQQGQYQLLSLTRRAREAELPVVRLVDTRRLAMEQGFSPQLLKALEQRLAAGEQSLIFLNRRGFAPALRCQSCGWISQCPRCTAYTVLHLREGRRQALHCHHCGYVAPAPRACPDCGDQDLQPMGRGTQRVESYLEDRYPEARVVRIDADSVRRKGAAAALFERVHAGEVDILIGTQMVAKGHDFAGLGLVGVLNADAALFAQDFRAPERLFAQLMQVAGRAGRHARGAEVIVQTDYPEQPVYRALLSYNYAGFARHSLAERESVGLPPYAHQALMTAEAKSLAQALAVLAEARRLPETLPGTRVAADRVTLYDPVPLRVLRVAHVERAQLLLESDSRPALQAFLASWYPEAAELARRARVRCQLEVDPLEI